MRYVLVLALTVTSGLVVVPGCDDGGDGDADSDSDGDGDADADSDIDDDADAEALAEPCSPMTELRVGEEIRVELQRYGAPDYGICATGESGYYPDTELLFTAPHDGFFLFQGRSNVGYGFYGPEVSLYDGACPSSGELLGCADGYGRADEDGAENGGGRFVAHLVEGQSATFVASHRTNELLDRDREIAITVSERECPNADVGVDETIELEMLETLTIATPCEYRDYGWWPPLYQGVARFVAPLAGSYRILVDHFSVFSFVEGESCLGAPVELCLPAGPALEVETRTLEAGQSLLIVVASSDGVPVPLTVHRVE